MLGQLRYIVHTLQKIPPNIRFAYMVVFLLALLGGELALAGYVLSSNPPPSPPPTTPLPTTIPSPTSTPSPTVTPVPQIPRPATLSARPQVKPPPPKTFNYTGDDIWQALATYRVSHKRYQFIKDDRLCAVANDRLKQLTALGTLDAHKGFKERFSNDDAFKAVGFAKIAENLAYGFETATAVIEWGWDTSTAGHREAQLTSEYTHACTASTQGFAVLTLASEPL